MAKQLNVNLAFTADTSRVKQDLEQLQNLLNRLTTNSAQKSPLGITSEIKTAISDVAKLESALKKATTSTGSLDLGQFKQELGQAGLTAEKIATQLATLGPEGKRAFAQLTQSVMSAEIPLKQTSTLLSSFATVLKNTARWQISSSILHGFIGSIQTAYHYAEDLNKSLNNIRIVTGKSVDEMSDFASEANEAAQALSTTTTEYTNASLIYYQQGLDDEAVKERTDATVKMANVTRESAEEVSQQMTAIWNNFDDGTKSLEYYSDVVTALGAATASSSAEIAQGLEKFAAAADTVGLSYEYATAALATVTATTRQSADVVGNAFKTLFSRMQGLKLGETLDDGTDLNKYSKALDAVGISIKTTDGQLKEMDQILNELGARWQTLSKDQQMALAQTVAGVRQYTQLIALMDNWDFFEQNVRIAQDAEGTLDKQFKIYEESWEAAQKRFSAAMQEIYTQLLNDDFFIDLTNSLTKIVQTIAKVVDSFGGLQGLLPGISALLLKMFGSDMAAAMERFAYNLQLGGKAANEALLQQREQFANELKNMQADGTIVGDTIANIYKQQGEAQDSLIQKVRELQAQNNSLSEEEQSHIKILMDYERALGEINIKEAQKLEILQNETQLLKDQTIARAKAYAKTDSNFNADNFEQQLNKFQEMQMIAEKMNTLKEQFSNIQNDEQGIQNIQKIIEELNNLNATTQSNIDSVQDLYIAVENWKNAKGPQEIATTFQEVENAIEAVREEAIIAFDEMKDGFQVDGEAANRAKDSLERFADKLSETANQEDKFAISSVNAARGAEALGGAVSDAQGKVMSFSEKFVAFGSALSSFAMALQSINSIINTINNPDLSSWEKFINITMSLGMLMPSLIRTWTQFTTLFNAQIKSINVYNAQKAKSIALQAKENLLASISSTNKEKEVAQILSLLTVEEKEKILKGELTLVEAILNIEKREGISIDKRQFGEKTKLCAKMKEVIALELEEAAALAASHPVILGVTIAIAALGAGLFFYAKYLEKVAKQQKEAAENATELAKKSRDEVESNQELVLSYEELLDKYKKGEIGKSELYDTTNKLAQAYDIEGSAVANLTGQYDNFTEAVKRASAAELERQKQLEKDAYEKNTAGMIAAGSEGLGTFNDFTRLYTGKDYNYFAYNYHDVTKALAQTLSFTPGLSGLGLGLGIFNEKTDRTDEIQKVIEEVTGEKGRGLSIKDASDPSEVIKYYEQLAEVKKRLIEDYNFKEIDSEIISLNEELGQMEQYYDAAVEHAQNYNQLLMQQVGNEKSATEISSRDQVEELKQALKNELKNKGTNIENGEIDDLVQNYLRNLNSEIINRVLAEEELSAQGLNEEIIKTYLNLSDSDRDALIKYGVKLEYYIEDDNAEKFKQDVEDALTLNKINNVKVSIPINLAADINETVLKGKTVNKETWEELQASAPNAEDILGERDEFNNKSISERIRLISDLNNALIEQDEEVAKLDKAQKQSAERRLEDTKKLQEEKEKEIENLKEERNTVAKSDAAYQSYSAAISRAENEVNELIAQEERLNAIIESSSYDAAASELTNVINKLLSDISLVQEGTELIGDNWTVAAENVEQFVRLMPEIISDQEELNFLEDGSLKLTESQVALVLNANREIIDSNKEVVITAIQDKITQLQAENEFYKKQIELLKDSLQHHENYDKNIKEMDQNTQEYANQLKELGVQVDSEAWEEMIDHSADGADAIQQNLEKIYNRIQEIHDAYGKMLTTDELGGFNIEGVTKTSLGDSKWRADVSTEDIDSFWDEDRAAIFQAQIDQYQKSIEENEDLIAQYTGAIAKIKSGADEVGKAIDRVNSGKAGKEEKKKGGSSKDPDKKDHTDDEVDRYYEIENAIAEINHQLEINEQIQKRLSAYQNHYAGKTLIASLKKQNDLLKERNGILEKQYKNYEKLYEIQLKELGELKGKIGGNWNGNELTNYAELMQANIDKYNAVIDSYNAMSADQQKSTGKEMVEDAKKVYDKYKKALEDYQDLYYNKMYDTENKLAEMRQQQLENQFKIIENNLKGWETEVELKLDMTKMKREWKAFIHDVEQDFRKIYENLSLDSALNRSDFDTYVDDAETRLKQIADVEAELRKMDASKDANGAVQLSDDYLFGSISEAQEYLKELQGELIDVGDSLNDMYEKVWDNYIKGLDQAKDNFEDINKEIEHLTEELEYEKQIIELIYGDKAYDMMSKYYSTQQMAIENQISSTRTQAQFWEDQLQKAYQMNKDKHNVNMNDMSTWTEDMKKAYEEMISAQEKLNDLVLEGIKNLKDEYLNNVAKTLQEMDKAIWGMDFDDLKEDWDFLQKKADEYLDDVEGAYKIQDLANKIDQSIADSSSLKAQQKLRDLREDEITMLREKEHLTQSDIDLAEARYQIALKELALEDAQNNKTSMKLTRDTSGNWTYQYVADEEEVTNKRQELLDAYNNLYEIADEAYKHAMELAMEMYEGYKDKIVEIAEDTTISEEEKLQKMQELRDQYIPEIIAAMENAQVYEQETIMATAAIFSEVCEQDADAYTTLTDLQKELVDMVKDQHLEDYEEIRNAILNNYQEIGEKAKETFNETNINSQTTASSVIAQWDKDNGNSVKGAMNDAFDNIIKYTQNFEYELYRLEAISGKTIMDAGGVVDDIDNIGYAIEEVGYKTEDMVNTAESYLDNLRGYVNEVENAWEQVVSRIKEAISALQEYLNMSEAVSAEEARRQAVAAAKAAEEARKVSSSSSGSGSGSGGGGAGSKSGITGSYSDPYGAYGTTAYTDSSGITKITGNSRSSLGHNITGVKEIAGTGGLYNVNVSDGLSTKSYVLSKEDLHKLGYGSFATGGYTGDWDTESGRLAILHQKELVLNATDTENMLAAVNTIRDMARLNDSISETIANSIGQLIVKAMGTGNTNISTINNSTNNTSNNTFNITAEFPNANDVQTIRDAILSLPNIASQYVNSF